MNLFKRLTRAFSSVPEDPGVYFFLRCARCAEVIQVRINPMNDLSVQYSDETNTRSDTFFIHKMIVGRRCYNRIEADFTFDKNRNLAEKTVTGGTFVTKEDFEADLKAHPAVS